MTSIRLTPEPGTDSDRQCEEIEQAVEEADAGDFATPEEMEAVNDKYRPKEGSHVNQPRYTLAEMMEQCDLSAPMTEEDRAWLDLIPVGREIIP